MNRDNTPWWPVQPASVEWTEAGAPYSSRFGDVYYSRENGMAESRHVFMSGNNLPARWAGSTQAQFCIGETGFGTGLNFLLSWHLWRQQPEPRPRLHFVSVEKFPLEKSALARALSNWPELAPLAELLLQAWPGQLPGQHRLLLDSGRVTLDLWWEDVADALRDLAVHGARVDAWFLDGFAPSRNESMWRQEVYEGIAALSRPGASFATFTAAGHVRRGLASAGFEVHKVPGFGRKRECLRGTFEPTEAARPVDLDTPWDLPAINAGLPREAIVIGAGLAGCSTAEALARRGLRVYLLDSVTVAHGASGNEQGILYTRLSRTHSTLTDFALQSFNFAASLYEQMFDDGRLRAGLDGALCGSFHQQSSEEEMAILQERLAGMPGLASVLTPSQAAEHLGLEPSLGGYWFPRSGWLCPPSVCRALIDHDNIVLQENCAKLSLSQSGNRWEARSGDQLLASADCVIVCTGTGANSLPELAWLPLQAIRGQTTHIPRNPHSDTLRAALCHEGYISPDRQGRHCIGATFNLRDPDTSLRPRDHQHNIEKLSDALPAWRDTLGELELEKLPGRVGFRCASPDYLPIAGAVPDRDRFLHNYSGLRKNARQVIPRRGAYVPGLYVNTAHGSRGLSSAPLVAELLASNICYEPLPVSRGLSRALSPARFLIRDLCRNRI